MEGHNHEWLFKWGKSSTSLMSQTGQGNVVYHTENWKELIVKIAGEFNPIRDSRDSWLLRAARLAQISHRQASDLFYQRAKRDPNYSIGIRVKATADKIDAIEKARREAAHLTSQYLQIVTVRGSINVSENLLGETALEILNTSRLLGGDHLPGNYGITIKPKGNAT